ncbi:MAG: ABC transporter ATP-binding protein [Actinobacteria bacterium]|nr:MAG: ABC transporter ATP-binding protein [Actinomycetota bacterium]
MTRLLEARGLNAGYDQVAVVRDLDLYVDAGEVVALLGPNGAGKTTTLLTLSGDLPALSGDVMFKGAPTKAPLHRRARQGLAFVTEERSVFMRLSTAENLRVGRGEMSRALELFPELASRLKVPAGLLSGGEQQMLTLARALSRDTDLLLADELSLGLAPLAVQRLLRAVRLAADRGVGVLLVEQHIRHALEIADRAYVMRRGRVEMSGTAGELRDRLRDIEASYLSSAEVPSSNGERSS